MTLIEITEKNIKEHTKKCVVLKMHRHAGVNLIPGSIVIKEGEFLYDALNRGLVRMYDPALDDPKEDPTPENVIPSASSRAETRDEGESSEKSVTIEEPKKLGPRKRKSKKE